MLLIEVFAVLKPSFDKSKISISTEETASEKQLIAQCLYLYSLVIDLITSDYSQRLLSSVANIITLMLHELKCTYYYQSWSV